MKECILYDSIYSNRNQSNCHLRPGIEGKRQGETCWGDGNVLLEDWGSSKMSLSNFNF